MEIKFELPPDLFDAEFTATEFGARVRELAILELLRLRRIHEHDAQRMLRLERWELVERMERAGITPTEKVFAEISGELGELIAARRRNRI